MVFRKHIEIFIQKKKTGWEERINDISVIIAINFLIKIRGKKDIWKIFQEGQGLFIILITKT